MRRLLPSAAAIAASIISTTVLAADKGGPAPAPHPQVVEADAGAVSWSCYVQGLGGASISTLHTQGIDAGISATGINALGGVGCDARHGRYVLGLVGRYEKGIGSQDALQLDHAWSAALRAGYLINPGVMVFGLAGGAQQTFRADGISQDGKGLLLGSGMEIDLGHNLALTAQYEYTRLGHWQDSGITVDPANHMVRLGLTLRFVGTPFDTAK